MLTLLSGGVIAEERMELQGTSVIGSKELPNVLYIVPWKKSGIGETLPPPDADLEDDLMQPLDRETFRTQVDFHYMLHPKP